MTLREPPNVRYGRYRDVLRDRSLPLALVDLDALEHNIDAIAAMVRPGGRKLRVASKSIRSPALLKRIVERVGDVVSGVMTYAAAETLYLAEQGFTDLLLAYPTVNRADVEQLVKANALGVTAAVVVDCVDHLDALQQAAGSTVIPVIVDVDVSWRPLGDVLHLGVRRSPLRTAHDVVELLEQVQQRPNLRFHGVMAYEAQIAGLPDDNPFAPLMNGPKRAIKAFSRTDVEHTRQQIAQVLRERNVPCPVFNGGGTGSLRWCTQESALTEVTAGSGFFASHLFDYYVDLSLEPACGFALQVVRRPTADMVTCHGGGYVASGAVGADRLPVPWLPSGLSLLPMEGVGEVQTPLQLENGVQLRVGDPVFFRHAKAGELSEHFDAYALIRGERVEGEARTYRGLQRCFLG